MHPIHFPCSSIYARLGIGLKSKSLLTPLSGVPTILVLSLEGGHLLKSLKVTKELLFKYSNTLTMICQVSLTDFETQTSRYTIPRFIQSRSTNYNHHRFFLTFTTPVPKVQLILQFQDLATLHCGISFNEVVLLKRSTSPD